MSGAHLQEWLVQNYKQYSSVAKLRRACRVATGATADSVRHSHNKLIGRGKAIVEVDPEDDDQGLIPADELLRDLDEVAVLAKYLDETVQDNYIPQQRLQQNLNLTDAQFRRAINNPRFTSRKISVNDRRSRSKTIVMWSSEAGIERIRHSLRGPRK